MANDEQIQYVVAQPHHRDGILKLAETSVIPFEPVSAALKATWDESKDSWESLVDAALAEPVSHIAVNSKNEVIGFRLTQIVDLEKHDRDVNLYAFLPEGVLRKLLLDLTKDWATVFPTKGKLLHFIGLCVHYEYGRRGIGLEMTKRNLELGRKLGCSVSAVTASNWMSQHVFEKAGFKEIAVQYFKDCKDENGKELFHVEDPKQFCTKFYIQYLQ